MRPCLTRRAFVFSMTVLMSLTGCGGVSPGPPAAVAGRPLPTDSQPIPTSAKTTDSVRSGQLADNQRQDNATNSTQSNNAVPGQTAPAEAQSGARYAISVDIYDTESVEFVPHTGPGKFDRYLAMNVPFGPVEQLREQLENTLNISLKHRGEAHITVVTPPEFERLSPTVSIQDINLIASNNIQSQAFRIDCLGESKTTLKGDIARTFFLVVSSENLEAMRTQIGLAYESSGGAGPAFLAEYYPHITVGFTHRDLHGSDGAIKNSVSCIEPIETR